MDRGDHSRGGSQPRRARWLAPVAAVAGLALSGTALAALPANVATVVGKPISRQEFNHWMVMTARAQPGPLVVAIDPPRFDHCIAQARAGLPSLRHDSTRALRKDCKELFRNVSNVVLDFLISADWHEAGGRQGRHPDHHGAGGSRVRGAATRAVSEALAVHALSPAKRSDGG
jgi:hypothetical protein